MSISIHPTNKKVAISVLLLVFVGCLSAFALTAYRNQPSALAAVKEDWSAGNIISDTAFTDKDSMSVSDIQAFLDSKITCDIQGTGKATEFQSSLTRAQYAASRGWAAPPYTCLNKYYEVPKTTPGGNMPANNYSNPTSIPSGAQSAAWIIKDAANRYNISPKVLLVKIATESVGPLTSDNWPLFSQYRYAMGSHCPDSGPGGSANCDTAYAGFSIQMYSAAELMRWYLDSMDQSWWTYKKPGVNYVLWNVTQRGCGGANVTIQNKATAALYTYTPYQPNQAALNNMYGTGDNCSAYGNRNFWRVYWDWFGNTRVESYSWSSVSQGIFTDNARTKKLPYNTVLAPGQKVYITIKAKNTGSTTWSNTNVLLGTSKNNDRKSDFYDKSWIDANRPARLIESTVAPGETGTFNFTINAPNKISTYKEYFNIVIEGSRWLSDIGLFFPIEVKNTRAVTLYSNSARTAIATKANTGDLVYARATIVNNSSTTLPANTRIATTNPSDRQSTIKSAAWISPTRVTEIGKAIEPGKTSTVDFTIQAPDEITSISEKFGLAVDTNGGGWLETNTLTVTFSTQKKATDKLLQQEIMAMNSSISSVSGKHRLTLQSDGNLVLYSSSKAVWASNTVGKGGNRLTLQSDGNLVLYSSSKAVWASNTIGK